MRKATIISSVVNDKNSLVGFRAALKDTETGSITIETISLDMLQKRIKNLYEEHGKIPDGVLDMTNADYDYAYKTLVGRGTPLVRYPKVNTLFERVSSLNGFTGQSIIVDEDTGDQVGVVVFDANGKRFDLSFEKLIELESSGRYFITNFKIEKSDNDKHYVVPSENCEFFIVSKVSKVKKNTFFTSSKGETKEDVVSALPEVGIIRLDKDNLSELGMSAGQTLYLAGKNIEDISPYYSCIYEAIEKRMHPTLGTFAVTETTMYYDLEFPASLSVSEVSFVLLHEISHILMQHSVRRGNRQPLLWNIATDMYINSALMRDFDLDYNIEKKFEKGVLKTPELGVFPQLYNIVLDLSKDTPESIYEELLKENPNMSDNNSNSNSSSNSKENNSDSSSNTGSSSSKEDNSDSSSSMDNSTSDTSSSSSSDCFDDVIEKKDIRGNSSSSSQSQSSSSDSSSDSSESSSNDSSNESEDNEESKDSNTSNSDSGVSHASEIKDINVTFRGKKITGRMMCDIATDDATNSPETKQKNLENSKNTLQNAKTKVALKEAELGSPLEKSYSGGVGLIQRHIDFGLTEGIDWRLLMKNICVDKPKKMYTMAMPNIDYMNRGITLAERHKIGKPTRAAKFVVAIDVSGSVSEKDLEYFLSEVNTLTTRFDVEAELVYWSTYVGDSGMFSKMKDLLKVNPLSSGGTDVSCLFKYLMGDILTETGKKEPLRVKDIKGVFIITDGCFYKNYDFAKDYFGKKTVWLIDGSPVAFDACFGRVFKLEKSNK